LKGKNKCWSSKSKHIFCNTSDCFGTSGRSSFRPFCAIATFYDHYHYQAM